nr:putative DNA repair exonuclease SbcCD [Oceanusvirus sp.]
MSEEDRETCVVLSDARVSRIYHVADLHVRVDSHRIDEYRSVFSRFLDDVEREEADSPDPGAALIVVCGDVMDTKCKAGTDGALMLFRWLERAAAIAPVLLICGNHDYRQDDPDIADAVSMLVAPFSQTTRIRYLEKTGAYRWGNVGFGVVSVKDTLRPRNTSGMVDELPPFPRPPPRADGIERTVALFHGTIHRSRMASGASCPSGYPVDWFSGYDFAMLGDNHTQQVNGGGSGCGNGSGGDSDSDSGGVLWAYPGSLVQQNFGEPLLGHGYVLWDVSANTAEPRHVRNDRGLITVDQDGRTVLAQGGPRVPLADALAHASDPVIRARGDRLSVEKAAEKSGLLPSAVVASCAPRELSDDAEEISQQDLRDVGSEAWTAFMTEGGIADAAEYVGGRRFDTGGEDPEGDRELRKLADAFIECRGRIAAEIGDILFRRAEWGWLMCFGPDNSFDFAACGGQVVLLSGKNATGKTSFLDVLMISVYGVAPGRSTIVNTRKPPSARAWVRLAFSMDGKEHAIERRLCGRSTARVVDARGYVLAEGVVKTDAWVRERFGRPEDMVTSCFLTQSGDSFFSKKPAEKREALDAALDSEGLAKFQKLVTRAVSIHNRLVDRKEAVLAERRDAQKIVEGASRETGRSNARDSREIRQELASLSPSDIGAEERSLATWEARQRPEWLLRPQSIAEHLQASLGEISRRKDRAEELTAAGFLGGGETASSPQAHPPRPPRLDVSAAVTARQRSRESAPGAERAAEERREISGKWPCLLYPDQRKRKTEKLARRLEEARRRADRLFCPEPGRDRVRSVRPHVEAALSRMAEKARETEESVAGARAMVARLGVCGLCSEKILANADAAEREARMLRAEMTETALAVGHESADAAAAAGAWAERDQYTAAREERDAAQRDLDRFRKDSERYDELEWSESAAKDVAFLRDCAAEWKRETEEIARVMEFHAAEIAAMRAFADGHDQWLQRTAAVRNARNAQRRLSEELGKALEEESYAAAIRAAALVAAERTEELAREVEGARKRRDEIRNVYNRMFGTDAYRAWVYRSRIAPALQREMNRILVPSAGIEAAVGIGSKKQDVSFRIKDRGSAIPLENASGFQRFVADLAVRIALARMAGGKGVRHLFLDEGFTACDADNVREARGVIDRMRKAGRYDSVVMVSHLEAIRDAADVCVHVQKTGDQSRIFI